MAIAQIDDDGTGGNIQSDAATYANARSGAGTVAFSVVDHSEVGQLLSGNYYCHQMLLAFVISLPADATVTAASLSLARNEDHTTDGDFIVEVRENNWGATGEAGDFIAGASLSGNTLLCSILAQSMSTTRAALTNSGSALVDAIQAKVGGSRLTVNISSNAQRQNVDPASDHYINIPTVTYATSNMRPLLEVTYTSLSQSGALAFF